MESSNNPNTNSNNHLNLNKSISGDKASQEKYLQEVTHDKLDANFCELDNTTNNIFDLQKSIGQNIPKRAYNKLIHWGKQNEILMKKTYEHDAKLIDEDLSSDSPVVNPELDKKTLAFDNGSFNHQSYLVQKGDEHLEKSGAKQHASPQTLQDYFVSLSKRNWLMAERTELTKTRNFELDRIINQTQEPILQGQNIPSETSQGSQAQQAESSKRPTSLIDDYANVSEELPDYTGGDD
jgi:hypothetical protein